jgi:VNT family MFS transporter (synaptic vesicle glycoprotein 2)
MIDENLENGVDSTMSTKSETGRPSTKECGADFETAISETGFGIFNFLLLLVTIPSILTTQFETSALSYVFPAAQCDLNLSLEDKGSVNAITYTGMIISCFIWGSLIDVFGRRKILIITHLLDSVFILMVTFAPNISVLIAAKFFGGFIINGTSVALTPYLSEFHGTHYRSRVPLTIGLLFSAGNIVLPLLAWAILPLNIELSLFGGLEFHAWNLFLLICTLPAILTGILFILMPESPKYLMAKGNNAKALEVFKKIYKLNSGQSRDNYPIKKLTDDRQIYQKKHTIKEAWNQISPLFSMKYATKLILVCSLQLFLMMCVNSLRLWLPEIFQVINDYEYDNNGTSSICKMLDNMQPTIINEGEICSVNFNNSSVYINSAIVGTTAVVGYIAAALFVNKLGKKKLLSTLGIISGTCVACVYFAPNSTIALVLICIHLMASCVCIDIIFTITVDLFPTYLRASALSLAFMSGRIGSVFGNLTFPYLLQAGCAPPFFTLGCIIIGCTILSLLLPNTDLKALE